MNQYLEHQLFKELQPHIVTRFIKFHVENPHVYGLVKKYANEAKSASRSRFGIAMIWERMRWYVTVETNDKKFKLNNNHKAGYARMLMIDDPYFMEMFNRRSTTNSEKCEHPYNGNMCLGTAPDKKCENCGCYGYND